MNQSNQKTTSLLRLLSELFAFVDDKRKYQAIALLLLTLLGSIAEIVSLGAVVPFIGVLIEPEKIFFNAYLANFISILQIQSPQELILPLTIFFVLASLCAGAIRLILLWVSIRLTNLTGIDLGTESYRRTLFQDYSVHVSRSSSEVISGIIQKIDAATAVLYAIITVISSLALLLAILGTLLFIDPIISSIALITLGLSYFFIALFTRKRLTVNSINVASSQSHLIKLLQEGLGAIRDILLSGTQDIYTKDFRKSITTLRFATGENLYITTAPRFALESLGMILIAGLAYSLSFQPDGIKASLPMLAALALGAQRLLPLLQVLYGNWSLVLGSKASIVDALELLNQPLPDDIGLPEPKPYIFKDSIEFKNINFSYPGSNKLVLNKIDLKIDKGNKIGFCGTTGGGKSTMMDLLMMLLESTSGSILVDGKILTASSIRAWQLAIAHVPQNVFLSDNTIYENVALGVPKNEINHNKVIKACKQAQISDFIEKSTDGYETVVGEQGVRLSGGQKQRIAIARAFYRNTSILVFDEATSALDSETESAVMKAIDLLPEEITVLIIAHRISTLKVTDKIYRLEEGEITFQGNYQDFIKHEVTL